MNRSPPPSRLAPLPGGKPRRFAFWFARVSRTLSLHLAQHVGREFGLNLAEYRVLNTLAEIGSASIREIAVLASLDKAQVTRAVTALTRRKLALQVVDSKDRRLRVVRLTGPGQELHAATLPFVEGRNRRLTRQLSAADVKVVSRAIELMSEAAFQMLEEETGAEESWLAPRISRLRNKRA
jgi:DNA-binding MarR family transcriptional regulator